MIVGVNDGDILTFSILWLSGESDDGDFDFFDLVTDWGVWGYGMETRSKEFTYEQYILWRIWLYRFVETMNEMNDKKETWIRLNGWAR